MANPLHSGRADPDRPTGPDGQRRDRYHYGRPRECRGSCGSGYWQQPVDAPVPVFHGHAGGTAAHYFRLQRCPGGGENHACNLAGALPGRRRIRDHDPAADSRAPGAGTSEPGSQYRTHHPGLPQCLRLGHPGAAVNDGTTGPDRWPRAHPRDHGILCTQHTDQSADELHLHLRQVGATCDGRCRLWLGHIHFQRCRGSGTARVSEPKPGLPSVSPDCRLGEAGPGRHALHPRHRRAHRLHHLCRGQPVLGHCSVSGTPWPGGGGRAPDCPERGISTVHAAVEHRYGADSPGQLPYRCPGARHRTPHLPKFTDSGGCYGAGFCNTAVCILPGDRSALYQ